MSTDRAIHLDIGLPPRSDLGTAARDTGLPTPKDERDEQQMEQDSRQFQAALKGAAPPATSAPMAARPFDLFSPLAPAAPATPAAGPGRRARGRPRRRG